MIPGGGNLEGIDENIIETQNLQLLDYTSVKKFNQLFSNNRSIFSQNVRSLARNGDKLNDLVTRTAPSIVALQEVWKGSVSIEGYNSIIKERDSRGGGVGFLIEDSLQFQLVSHKQNFNFEYIVISIESVYYASIYIPHRGNAEAGLQTLLQDLRKYARKEIFIMGDFNIDLLKNDYLASKFHEFMQSLNLYPTIGRPTRTKSLTLLDNILTNTSKPITSGILPTSVSDHMTPFLAFDRHKRSRSKAVFKKRIFSPENIENLKLLLKYEDWETLNELEPEEKYNHFNHIFSCNLDLCCPEVEFERRRDKTKLNKWYTDGLLVSHKTKEKYLEILAQKSNPHYNWQYYTSYVNLYYKVARAAKSKFWADFVKENYQNMKLIWQETNKALGRGKKINLFRKHCKCI